MQNQKLENQLNLALEATPEERERSLELDTGYNPMEQSWQLIVKYSGSLDAIRALGVLVEEMRNEYAILTVPESMIDEISAFPQIEYVEKPKRLFFVISQAKAASCINPLQEEPFLLTGKGVLIGILDSGIDYYLDDFRNADGTTRILFLWDQVLDRVFTEQEINQALEAGSRRQALELVPSTDGSGHGTAVAGIAAGFKSGGENPYRGIACESKLLVVKLGNTIAGGFPRTTELIKGINYLVTEAVNLGFPLAVNISFGNTYGSHDGTSLLETFLNDIGNYGRTTIVVGSGNEGAAAGHISGTLKSTQTKVELSVAPYETGFSVQLWKSYTDEFAIQILTPSGEILGPLVSTLGSQRYEYKKTQIFLYYGKPSPYSVSQEIYFDFIPMEGYVSSGIWTFILTPREVTGGKYDFWLPSSGVLNSSTRFLSSTPDTTLTIPSTASKVITVGAYDSRLDAYADFSGRGFTRLEQVKPDLVAPGVNIRAPLSGGGYEAVTGTSFATPIVTGSAALMMQWGIVDGNDSFLYGEKIKAYLHKGARPFPGQVPSPNPLVGYGRLCLRNSLPI